MLCRFMRVEPCNATSECHVLIEHGLERRIDAGPLEVGDDLRGMLEERAKFLGRKYYN